MYNNNNSTNRVYGITQQQSNMNQSHNNIA